uniref:3-oxoacyl-[acyl-carrier-protein] reductase n=1 Tax=Steinernema glaseri TaxID=37863 RepID=A0A1I7Z164_9BILA
MAVGTRFAGKSVIITGASSGIGRGVAVYLAQEGAQLVIAGRNTEQLEETKRVCVAEGASEANVVCVSGDITDTGVQKKLLEAALEAFQKLDILINNAGALFVEGHKTSTVADPIEVYEKLMDLNLKSVVQMTQVCVEELKKTKGNIVNVSSISSTVPLCRQTFYSTSKAAVDQFTRNVALDLAVHGVRVNAVNPGFISTNLITREGVNEVLLKKFEESIEISNPLGRFGSVEEIARSIGFLADNRDAGYVTGHCLVVDGGSTLANCCAASHYGRSLSMLP